MTGVLIGFGIIGTIILIGYLVGRLDILGENAGYVLSRIVFFVLTPCLLFVTIAEADVHVLFSGMLLVSLISAVVVALVYTLIAVFVLRRRTPETVIGALSASYVNSNNIGLPVAIYVLGDPAYAVPVLLMQLIVLSPVALTILDLRTGGPASVGRILMLPITNPLIIASVLGVVVAVVGLEIPAPIMEPFALIGAAAIPVVLMSFGMSLHGNRLLQPGTGRQDVAVASTLKLVVMPVLAYLLGVFVFHFEGQQLFAVVALAALPTAQNVFNFAQRYQRAVVLARDTSIITTIGAVPVLLVVAALLSSG